MISPWSDVGCVQCTTNSVMNIYARGMAVQFPAQYSVQFCTETIDMTQRNLSLANTSFMKQNEHIVPQQKYLKECITHCDAITSVMAP